MNKFQVRDEGNGCWGVVWHDDATGLVWAHPIVHSSRIIALGWVSYYEKRPSKAGVKNKGKVRWVLVGKH